MTPAADPDISKQHQSSHQKRDVETPLPFSTIHVGRIPGVLRDLQNVLRNSTSRSADLATLETLETQLDQSLITEQFAHIFIGAGRFEVVSSLEAQLWRAERREFIESGSHKKQAGMATVSDALIIGGSLLPDFFPELQSASRVESRQAPLVEFANGELLPRVGSGVGWKNVFLLYQSDGTSNNPLVELMLQVDAVRRAGAAHITVVAPAFPYQRGDKRGAEGTPIPAAAITRILEGQGVGRFVCFDLHAGQAEGFASVPMTNLSALPLLTREIGARYPGKEFVIALPDEGMGKRLKDDNTRSIISANLAGASFLQMAKDRIEVNEVNSAHLKGGKIDLSGKIVLLLDDMIDTGGTMRMAARALLDAGADKILAAATHGIFSSDAIERFREDREGHRSPRKPARFKAKGKEKTVRGTSISLRERWRDL